MAALDFGMALARGMLPTTQKAQEDLLDLAGGRNVFKSESWWQEQVDKQIDKGYRRQDYQKQYLVDVGLANSWMIPQPSGVTEWRPEVYSSMGQKAPPKGAIEDRSKQFSILGPRSYFTREVSLGFTKSGRDWFESNELKDIERSAESGARQAKRETAQAETAKKRLTRGTGGLAAKARPVGAKATTGLPELGTGGLQLGATSLGKGLLV
jgi:hypothetical protein